MSSTNTQALPARRAELAVRRLKVLAEADAGALARILQPFQSLNIVPFSVRVARVGDSYLEVGVEIAEGDLSSDALLQVTAKLGQVPLVLAAVACE